MSQKKRPFGDFAEGLREIRKKRPSDAEIEKFNKIIEESNSEDTCKNDEDYSEAPKKIAIDNDREDQVQH